VSSSPKDLKKYINHCDGKPGKLASKFFARYRMAKQFESANFKGASKKLQEGYSAIIRVGLAYSALESLERLTGVPRSAHKPIIETDLALALRSPDVDKLFEELKRDLDSWQLKTRIESSHRGESDDVRPIAEGIRHLTFHGHATVHSFGLDTVGTREIIFDLADYLLEYCDSEFSAFLFSKEITK
jgi:hypothetical protein